MSETAVAIETLKPLLKWAGGKRWQLPYLRPLWEPQQHRRLVEPFCGGLAVTLGLQPERALLNDINQHLVNFYRWVQEGGLSGSVLMANDRTVYDANRARFNALLRGGHWHTQEAATLFYYLNRTGFNGLCRFNSKGGFNVPFGKYATINYRTEFPEHAAVFANWRFSRGDFREVAIEPSDFIYADPPYDVPFTEYSAGGFGWQDQVRVAERLAQHPGPVVLANQATDRILTLYGSLGFTVYGLDAPRRISCTGDRKPAREVLATRNILASPFQDSTR